MIYQSTIKGIDKYRINTISETESIKLILWINNKDMSFQ